MSELGWLGVGALLVLVGLWMGFTTTRLDRLHARVDATYASLDAALVRRAAAVLHLADNCESEAHEADSVDRPTSTPSPQPSPPALRAAAVRGDVGLAAPGDRPRAAAGAVRPPAPLPDRLATAAQSALAAGDGDRERMENVVSKVINELGSHRDELLSRLDKSVHEITEASARVVLARRFYNDAVRDTRSLRARRLPRLLHMAGHRELPGFFDIDDSTTMTLTYPVR